MHGETAADGSLRGVGGIAARSGAGSDKMDLRDTIRTYRLFSGSYDVVFGPVFHPGRKEAVRIVNDRPAQQILEVGVGTGLSLPYFRPDSHLTGVDISMEMLAKARRRVEKQQLTNVAG